MLSELTRQDDMPASELARLLHRELLKEGPDAIAASYAEALVVLEYMHNQYGAAAEAPSLDLAEEFAEKEEFLKLFKSAWNNPVEKNPPRDDEKFYNDCQKTYGRLRPIADSVDETPAEKKRGIVKLSERLHSDCAKEGGHIYRLISRDGAFREQK